MGSSRTLKRRQQRQQAKTRPIRRMTAIERMVFDESMRCLTNTIKLSDLLSRSYDETFTVTGAKIGESFSIRLPQRYR